MKIFDLLSLSIRNLIRRKFRTAMTVIGVIVGTTAIISMIALGLGISKSYDDLLSSWGDLSIIEVWQYGPDASSVLDDASLNAILAIDGVESASPFLRMSFGDGKILAGKRGKYTAGPYLITGVYTDALETMGYPLAEGELMKENNRVIEVVASSHVAYQFEDPRKGWPNNMVYPYAEDGGEIPAPFFEMKDTPLQLVLTYDKDKELIYDIVITGYLEPQGDEPAYSEQGLYMDIKAMEQLYDEYNKATKKRDAPPFALGDVKVKVNDLDKAKAIEEQIAGMQFGTYSQQANRQGALDQVKQLQIILGALGGISLFVAAISIANTMVMSVYERTQEIGIMKVLGCFVSNIRTMFLTEAAIIGLLGGVLGVALSYLVSYLLNSYGSGDGSGGGGLGSMLGFMGGEGAQLSIIPLWLVLLGLSFSTLIGIISGIYPAYRAVRISALEAIKQE